MRAAARQQRVPEADARRSFRVRVMVAVQQRAAGCLSVGEPPGHQQAAGPFGEQPVAARIGRAHQPDRAFQEVRGDLWGCRRGFPGGPGQPPDGLGVSLPGSAGELLGDLQGWRRCSGLAAARPRGAAHGGR